MFRVMQPGPQGGSPFMLREYTRYLGLKDTVIPMPTRCLVRPQGHRKGKGYTLGVRTCHQIRVKTTVCAQAGSQRRDSRRGDP